MMKYSLPMVFAAILLLVAPVHAQQFTTHAVKEGESLRSISQKYRVTPYAILQANKELRSAADVKENTLLIIPLTGAAVTEAERQESIRTVPPLPEVKKDPEPIGFKRHRVRRKETMFGLTQKYQVTEDQIKRYNSQLYSEQLKKGMVLQIPEYPEVDPEEERALDFETYTVQPKETRWSIANKYGITVDSLMVLNPQLDRNSNYLAAGATLNLPRPKGDSLEDQQVALYTSYTVPAKMTLYSLGKAYGIPPDSIVRLNPEIVAQGGLKDGMVIRLPKRKDPTGLVNTENFVFYEVKPKQNIFRITQNLKISRDELFRLNPELENGLKAGMVLKLPRERAEGLEVKNALVLDRFSLIDSIDVKHRPRLVFMLPFRLDMINVGDREKAGNMIRNRNDVALSVGFYTGALVALDSIQKLGVSVDVRTYDTELSQAKVKEILKRDNLLGVKAIIGPVSSAALNEVAVQAASKRIPVIAPISSDSKLSHDNVFFSVPRESVMREKLLGYMKGIHKGENVIIVADSTNQVALDSILSAFPAAQIAEIIDNKSLPLDKFLVKLSETKENWVFLETSQPNMVSSVTSILNSAISDKVKVRMFTTGYNKAFEDDALSLAHLSNLRFTFPSFYRDVGDDSFSRAYEKRFGLEPDRYAIRGFDVTFDILLKLAHRNNLFETSRMVGLTEYTGNSFDYINNWDLGYFNRACFIMQYQNFQLNEIKTDDFKGNL